MSKNNQTYEHILENLNTITEISVRFYQQKYPSKSSKFCEDTVKEGYTRNKKILSV